MQVKDYKGIEGHEETRMRKGKGGAGGKGMRDMIWGMREKQEMSEDNEGDGLIACKIGKGMRDI